MNRLTRHATDRARTRRIPRAAISDAIDFGQLCARRGADIYTLGWRQVRHFAQQGIDLSRWEGTQVVCSPRDGGVLTVYRNRSRAMGDSRRRARRSH